VYKNGLEKFEKDRIAREKKVNEMIERI